MKTAKRLRQAHESIIELCVNSTEFNKMGTAIVLSRQPFRLLVPLHLIMAIEDGSAQDVTIENTVFRNIIPISSPLLEQHELAVLQINQPAPYHLRAIRLGRKCWVDAYPGQCGVLITPRLLSSHCRSGPVQTVHSDGKATIAVIDVPVVAGDSGSAVFVDGTFAGIVQGRQATEEGSKAIAVLFSSKVAEELRQLGGIQLPLMSKLVKAGLLVLACLCIVSVPLPNRALSSAKTVPSVSERGDYVCGAMPHAIDLVGNRCFVAQMDTGLLCEFDPQTGVHEKIADSIDQPCDMAASDDGSLFCVNENGLVMEIDVSTGDLLNTMSLHDFGLAPDDIVMGIATSRDGFVVLFYRNEKPYLLVPEDGYTAVRPIVSTAGELSGLQEVDGRFFTLEWQHMRICEIVRLDGVAHLVHVLDITEYISADELAAEGLRNFFIRDRTLYLTSVHYGSPRPDVATFHIIELENTL